MAWDGGGEVRSQWWYLLHPRSGISAKAREALEGPRPERIPARWGRDSLDAGRTAERPDPGPAVQEAPGAAGEGRASSPGAEGWKVQSRSAGARPGSLGPSAEGLST